MTMETKTLDFSETLRDSLCIGIKNAPSIWRPSCCTS